jgi:hypothetical protein
LIGLLIPVSNPWFADALTRRSAVVMPRWPPIIAGERAPRLPRSVVLESKAQRRELVSFGLAASDRRVEARDG